MNAVAASKLLRRHLPLRLDVTHRGCAYDAAFATELFDFSCALAVDERSVFQRHLDTCTEAHTLRCAETGRLRGFQQWRLERNDRYVMHHSGKLRMEPAIRRRGLHLLLNLVALDGAQLQSAASAADALPVYRMGLVNLFGFQALRPALASAVVPPLQAGGGPAAEVFEREMASFCRDNGFAMDPATYRVDITQTQPHVPSEFSEAYWSRPEVVEYREAGMPRNAPLSKQQALDREHLAWLCWEWDEDNVSSFTAQMLAKLTRDADDAGG